jgi:hypothetical protein
LTAPCINLLRQNIVSAGDGRDAKPARRHLVQDRQLLIIRATPPCPTPVKISTRPIPHLRSVAKYGISDVTSAASSNHKRELTRRLQTIAVPPVGRSRSP